MGVGMGEWMGGEVRGVMYMYIHVAVVYREILPTPKPRASFMSASIEAKLTKSIFLFGVSSFSTNE